MKRLGGEIGTVVVVESNRAGNGLRALNMAKAWGYQTVFACKDPAEYAAYTDDPVLAADECIVVDTLDPRWLQQRLIGRNIAAVVAYDEPSLVTAFTSAAVLGQNATPSLKGVSNTRFKHFMRSALDTTPFTVPWGLVDIDDHGASSPVGYPCVVKPCDVGGNYAITVCHDPFAFRGALQKVRELKAAGYGRYSPLDVALVESYLDGPEYSVEMAWSPRDRSWAVLGITEKSTTAASNPLEYRHLFPAPILPEAAKVIEEASRSCLNLLGLTDTLVHAEFIVTALGVKPVEVNCRPAGGHINDLVAMCYGQDLVETHLRIALGDGSCLDAFEQPAQNVAGIQYVIPQELGVVAALRLNGALPSGVSAFLAEPPLTVSQMHSDARLGYLIASGSDAGTVGAMLETASALVEVTYEAPPSVVRSGI